MEIEEYLSGFAKFTNKPSLDAMRWLMKEFNNPQDKLNIVHVAGTNGKGSVCEMLTNIGIKAGLKVGKFISPHLITFYETICINNKPISEQEVQEILQALSQKIEEYNKQHEIGVTWFEVITSLALIYFGKQNCDLVVLETGMGGTLDCTNIVNGMLSIITSIGYDHMEVLGKTLREIASNKAGIIKKEAATIFVKQTQEVDNVIKEKCEKEHNKLYILEPSQIKNYQYNKEYQSFDYKDYTKIEVNLKGKKQIQNAMVCIQAVEILNQKGYAISDKVMREGLKTVIHPARFEKLQENPTVIFDGGHNEKAIDNLKETIKQYYAKDKKVYIISILNTKDYQTIIKHLVTDSNAVYIFTSGNDSSRYIPKETLLKEAQKQTKGNLLSEELENALQMAITNYQDSVIFVVGSFYVYPTVLEKLKR